MEGPPCPKKRPISVVVSAFFNPINSANFNGIVTLQTRLENIVGYKISFANITANPSVPYSPVPQSYSASIWPIFSRTISSMASGTIVNIARSNNSNKSTAINESNCIGFISIQPSLFGPLQSSTNLNSYTPFNSSQWVESFDWSIIGLNTNLTSAGATSSATIEFIIDFYQECTCD